MMEMSQRVRHKFCTIFVSQCFDFRPLSAAIVVDQCPHIRIKASPRFHLQMYIRERCIRSDNKSNVRRIRAWFFYLFIPPVE
jgi:hypothetical protein